jgi:surface antigen
MKRNLVLMTLLAFLIASCAEPYPGPKETGGTIIGAGTGALLGSQVGKGEGRLVAVAIGTLAGALLGKDIGRSLDRADQLAMERNAQYALEFAPTNTTTTWRNPDSGNSGAVTPIETYQSSQGQYCREYRQTVWIGGEQQQAYGTACRQPDGTWKIIR